MLTTLLLSLALQMGPGDIASASSYWGGERWDFNVARTVLERSPKWDEADPSPPLPARRALAVSSKQLCALMGDCGQWTLSTLTLQPLASPGGWIYVVEYRRLPEVSGGPAGDFRIVVLMNGDVVAPKRSPWPPR